MKKLLSKLKEHFAEYGLLVGLLYFIFFLAAYVIFFPIYMLITILKFINEKSIILFGGKNENEVTEKWIHRYF